MEILEYRPDMLPDLTSAYNDLFAGLHHCYPVTVEDFASSVVPVEGKQTGRRLHSESAYIVATGKSILGFSHIAIERPRESGGSENGAIRFFWYKRGHRVAGQELLNRVEEHFRKRNLRRIIAFHQDHIYDMYHLAHCYMSDRLGHIYALMGFNGYKRVNGEVYLDWPDFDAIEPVPADVSAEITVEHQQGDGKRPDLTVSAYQGKKRVGICECASCGNYTRADAAQDWIFTTGLGVEGELQGKGLGRHILRRALQEAKELGYRHAVISANWENFRAILFYSNFGYKVSDWTYALGRDDGIIES